MLIGARPGHGKTVLSLELAVEAMKSGNRGVFFSLDYTEKDLLDRFRTIAVDWAQFNGLFEFDVSDDINATYIAERWRQRPGAPLWSSTICSYSIRSGGIRN